MALKEHDITSNCTSALPLMASNEHAQLEVSMLRQQEALLKTRLLERTQGLRAWKHTQARQAEELDSLRQRVEELCRVLRSRNEHIDRLLYTQADYAHQIKVLEVKVSNRKQGLRSVPDRKLNLPWVEHIHKRVAKLPTLVQGGKSCKEMVKRQYTDKLPSIPYGEKGRNCVCVDQWVNSEGQVVELPTLSVTFPREAVDGSVLVSLTMYPPNPDTIATLQRTGMSRYLDVCTSFSIQPYGYQFSRPVTVTLHDARPSGQGRFFIFTKEVDHHHDMDWSNSTDSCRPRFKQDYISFQLHKACIVTVVRVTVPMCGVQTGVIYTQGVGVCRQLVHTDIKTKALSIINNRCVAAFVSLYADVTNGKVLMVISNIEPNVSLQEPTSDIQLLKSQATWHDLCDGETIYPFIENLPLSNQELEVNIEQIQDAGQYAELCFTDIRNGKTKSTYELILKRKVANTDITDLCVLTIPKMIDKGWVGCHGYEAKQVLDLFEEKIVKGVDVRYLLDRLCTDSVFSQVEVFRISHERDRRSRTKHFLKLIRDKGEDAILMFHRALLPEYPQLASDMATFLTPTGKMSVNE